MILLLIVAFGLSGRSPLITIVLAALLFIALMRERALAMRPGFEIHSFGLISKKSLEGATWRRLLLMAAIVAFAPYSIGFAVSHLLFDTDLSTLHWTDPVFLGYVAFYLLAYPELARMNVRKDLKDDGR